jgi:hypothetical protein
MSNIVGTWVAGASRNPGRFLRRQPVPRGDARAISEPVTGIWHLVLDRLPRLLARVHEHDDLL